MNLTEFNKEMSSDDDAVARQCQGVFPAWHARDYAKPPTGKPVRPAGTFKSGSLHHPIAVFESVGEQVVDYNIAFG